MNIRREADNFYRLTRHDRIRPKFTRELCRKIFKGAVLSVAVDMFDNPVATANQLDRVFTEWVTKQRVVRPVSIAVDRKKSFRRK